MGDRFFPNSFSYGVFANIGSGAVPGRLPGGRFREGSGAGSEPPVPGHGSGKVPGQVPGMKTIRLRTGG